MSQLPVRYYVYPGLPEPSKADVRSVAKYATSTGTRIRRIVKAIERGTGFTLEQLQSKDRSHPLPFLRAIVAVQLYDHGIITLVKIGRLLRRDHTTIRHLKNDLYPQSKHLPKFKKYLDKVEPYL